MNNLEYYCSSYRKMSGVAITSHKLIKDPCSVKDPKSHRPKYYRFNDHNKMVEDMERIENKKEERLRKRKERAKNLREKRREFDKQAREREKNWRKKYGHSRDGWSTVRAVGNKVITSGFGGRSIRKHHAFNKLGTNKRFSFSDPHKPHIPLKLMPFFLSRGLLKKRTGFSKD